VDIYEVSQSTSLELGNQLSLSSLPVTETIGYDKDGKPVTVIRNSAALGNLGGIGRVGVAALAGTTFSPVLGGVGTILGLPPTSLSLLQSKANSRLLASTQIHALDGQQNQTKVGRSVPVRIGTNYVPGYGSIFQPQTPAGTAANTVNQLGLGNGAFDSIQYKDVGLVIDLTPQITNEGYVEIKMKLESTNVESSAGEINLTPSFTQRSLTTISRVQDGKTAVVAGVKQETKGASRSTIPVIGMIPVLGRFITTPKQQSNLSDIIITVTPHIIRSNELRREDHLAHFGGTFTAGIPPTIASVISRGQAEDEQERRLIAKQQEPQTGATPRTSTKSAETAGPVLTSASRVEAEGVAPAPKQTQPSALATPPPPLAVSTTPPSSAQPRADLSPKSKADSRAKSLPANPEVRSREGKTVDFSLIPSMIESPRGESFFVVVSVYGQVEMTEAQVLLKYDPEMLQFKAVRSGGLLGTRPNIIHQLEGDSLSIKVQQVGDQSAPALAVGQLLLVEFKALKPGRTLVDLDPSQTNLKLGNQTYSQVNIKGAQVTINREAGSGSGNREE